MVIGFSTGKTWIEIHDAGISFVQNPWTKRRDQAKVSYFGIEWGEAKVLSSCVIACIEWKVSINNDQNSENNKWKEKKRDGGKNGKESKVHTFLNVHHVTCIRVDGAAAMRLPPLLQPEHTERKDESRVERVKRIMLEANRSVCLCSRRTSVSANARQWHILTHTRTHARNQSCQKKRK